MSRYQVQILPAADRSLSKLDPRTRRRLADRMTELSLDPRPRGCKKLSGPGECYRVREGDYRIVYQVEDAVLTVLVIRIGHRREVYRS